MKNSSVRVSAASTESCRCATDQGASQSLGKDPLVNHMLNEEGEEEKTDNTSIGQSIERPIDQSMDQTINQTVD